MGGDGVRRGKRDPFGNAFVRNHYVGRTFLQPSQLIRDFGVQRDAHTEITDELARLQKCAADVVIADEGVAERDAAFLGEAHGGPVAAVGHGNDKIGLDGILARKSAPEINTGLGNVLVGQVAVGPREVHKFKNTERMRLLNVGPRVDGTNAVLVDDNNLAGGDIANILGMNEVERARLAGKHPGNATELPSSLGVGNLPSTSGRKPNGSRTPMSSSSPMITSE